MRYFTIAALLLVAGVVCAEEAATAPATMDATAKWIGYVWAAATALCAALTGIAALIRVFAPESKIAALIDSAAHFLGVVGTTVRPSQIAPKK
jgi:hypothetical protein